MINPVLDGWTLVIVGNWNPRIFRPEWLTNRVTNQTSIGFEVPVNNPGLPPRLRFDDIKLIVGSERLIINPDRADDSVLEKVRSTARTIVETLPHTPITAVGVNFLFLDDDPGPEVLGHFDVSDNPQLSDIGFVIGETSIKRSLSSNGAILNLTITRTGNDEVSFEFNYHQAAQSADEVSAFLDRTLAEFRDDALGLLNSVYAEAVG